MRQRRHSRIPLVLLLAIVAALAGLSVAVGLLLLLRTRRAVPTVSDTSTEVGLLRLRAVVRSGFEQTIIRTLHPLHLADSEDEVGYKELFRQSEVDGRVVIRSRSAIDRGLVSALTFTHTDQHTAVTYTILEPAGDEAVNAAVRRLETRIVLAIRDIDPDAEVSLSDDDA